MEPSEASRLRVHMQVLEAAASVALSHEADCQCTACRATRGADDAVESLMELFAAYGVAERPES